MYSVTLTIRLVSKKGFFVFGGIRPQYYVIYAEYYYSAEYQSSVFGRALLTQPGIFSFRPKYLLLVMPNYLCNIEKVNDRCTLYIVQK